MGFPIWLFSTVYGIRYYLEFNEYWLFAQAFFIMAQLFFIVYLLLKFISIDALKKIQINKYIFILLAIFIVFGWISIVRGALNGNTSFSRAIVQVVVSFFAFLNLFLYIANRIAQRNENAIWKDLAVGLLLLSLLNMVSYFFFNIKSPIDELYLKPIESNLKFIDYRMYFPFVYSNRVFTIEMGVLLLICGCLALFIKNKKLFLIYLAIIGCACALLSMLLSDGRIPFLFSFVCLLCLIFKKMTSRFIFIIMIGVILYPFLFAAYVATHLELIYQNNDLYTLNGRLQIWTYLFGKITQHFDVNYFFGFGAFGQRTSQYVYEYSQGFEGVFANIDIITAHNSFLQLFIDQGIIGLLILICLLFVMAKEVKKVKNRVIGTFSIILYLVATAGTEVSISIYYESILCLFMYCAFDVMIKKRSKISNELTGIPEINIEKTIRLNAL